MSRLGRVPVCAKRFSSRPSNRPRSACEHWPDFFQQHIALLGEQSRLQQRVLRALAARQRAKLLKNPRPSCEVSVLFQNFDAKEPEPEQPQRRI